MNIHATHEDQTEVKVRVTLTTEQKQHSGQEEQQVGSCQHTDEAQHSSNKQHDHIERQQDDERSLHVWKEKRSGCLSASHNPSRSMQIFSLMVFSQVVKYNNSHPFSDIIYQTNLTKLIVRF